MSMPPTPPPPIHHSPDHSAREAIVAVTVMVLSLAYSVTYCTLYGRIPENGQVEYAWGIPSWVMYGVIAPWLVGVVIAWWYAYQFMADETWDLDEESNTSSPEGTTHHGR